MFIQYKGNYCLKLCINSNNMYDIYLLFVEEEENFQQRYLIKTFNEKHHITNYVSILRCLSSPVKKTFFFSTILISWSI